MEKKQNENAKSNEVSKEDAKKQSREMKRQNGTPPEELKPVLSLREALQNAMNKEFSIKKKNGKVEKSTFLEALVTKTLEDAIENDGPTRRLLFRQDIINLAPEEEKEAEKKEEVMSSDEQKIAEVEKEYGKLLRQWAGMKPEFRKILSSIIVDLLNDATRKDD